MQRGRHFDRPSPPIVRYVLSVALQLSPAPPVGHVVARPFHGLYAVHIRLDNQ